MFCLNLQTLGLVSKQVLRVDPKFSVFWKDRSINIEFHIKRIFMLEYHFEGLEQSLESQQIHS